MMYICVARTTCSLPASHSYPPDWWYGIHHLIAARKSFYSSLFLSLFHWFIRLVGMLLPFIIVIYTPDVLCGAFRRSFTTCFQSLARRWPQMGGKTVSMHVYIIHTVYIHTIWVRDERARGAFIYNSIFQWLSSLLYAGFYTHLVQSPFLLLFLFMI